MAGTDLSVFIDCDDKVDVMLYSNVGAFTYVLRGVVFGSNDCGLALIDVDIIDADENVVAKRGRVVVPWNVVFTIMYREDEQKEQAS